MATTTRLRWIAPTAALALALGAPVAVSAVANADPSLPDKTAEELLEDLATAEPVAFSGTISQQVDLGLPDLSALEVAGPGGPRHSAAPFDPMTLVSGTNTWRVWTDGESSAKAALLVDGGEYSVTYTGSDVWFWDSAAGEATHVAVPPHEGAYSSAELPKVTPGELAEQLLAHIEPTTEVTTSGTRMVAGRASYELVLTPVDSVTKIGEVRLAVDSETSLPLALEVTSTAGTRAVDVEFTVISFATPDPATFDFTPPAAATVTEVPTPTADELEAAKEQFGDVEYCADAAGCSTEPTVVGEGWSSVVVLPAMPETAGASWDTGAAPQPEDSLAEYQDVAAGFESVLAQLPTVSGEWGSGKLFEGTLVSVLLADDGRIALGAVGPDALVAALTTAP